MEEEKRILEFEITVKEQTTWGLNHKTFSNKESKVNRAAVIIEAVEYLRENFHEDYVKAVKKLRRNK